MTNTMTELIEKVEPYICAFCGGNTKSEDDMWKHLRDEHDIPIPEGMIKAAQF